MKYKLEMYVDGQMIFIKESNNLLKVYNTYADYKEKYSDENTSFKWYIFKDGQYEERNYMNIQSCEDSTL